MAAWKPRKKLPSTTASTTAQPYSGLGLERLRRQAQSLLAVVTMAALWQDKFQGGWVDLHVATDLSLHLGKTTPDAPSEAARQAFYRAREALKDLGEPAFEEDEARAAIRLVSTPSADLQLWLQQRWTQLVTREAWQEFMSPASDWDIRYADAQTRVRDLLASGDSTAALKVIDDAIGGLLERDLLVGFYQRKGIAQLSDARLRARLEQALEEPSPPHPLPRVLDTIARLMLGRFDPRYVRQELVLARSTVLIHRRSVETLEEAERLLAQQVATLLPIRDIMDQLLVARVWIARARCRYYLPRLSGPLDRAETVFCDDALDRAEAHEAGLSPSDRSRILSLRAWLRLEDAAQSPEAHSSERLLAEARRLSRRAIQMGQLGQDRAAMREALAGLAVVDGTQLLANAPITVDGLAMVWNVRASAIRFGTHLDESSHRHVLSVRSLPENVGSRELESRHGASEVDSRLAKFQESLWNDHLASPQNLLSPSDHMNTAYTEYVDLARCVLARSAFQELDEATRRA